MGDESALERLDLIVAILKLAFDEQLGQVRTRLRSDPINVAILGASEDWVDSGELRKTVAKRTGAQERTIFRRLAELVAVGGLQHMGSAASRKYRSTGLL